MTSNRDDSEIALSDRSRPVPADSTESGGLLEQSFRSVGQGTAIMAMTTLILFSLNLVARVWAARELTVAEYGTYSLAISFTGLVSIVGLLGLNQATARSLAYETDPGERRAIIRWSLGVAAAVSFLLSLSVFLLAGPLSLLFHYPALEGVFQLLAVTVGFGSMTPVMGATFQGFHDVFPNAIFNQVVNPVLFLVFVVLLLGLDLNLLGLLIAYVIGDGAAFVGLAIYAYYRLPRLVPRDVPTPRRPKPQLWRLTVALWGVTSFAYITAFADTIILGFFRPVDQVGYYSTSMTLARVLLMGASALTFIFLPVTARLARNRAYGELGETYVTSTRWVLFLTVPLFLIFTITPNLVIDLLFGPKYLPSVAPLQILAVTAFVATLMGPVNATLAGLGRARNQVVTATVSAVTNIALSFSFIPIFGIFGAAASWGVARALYPGLGLSLLWRSYSITPFRRILLRPLFATFAVAVPMLLVVEFVFPNKFLVIPMFFLISLVYLAAILLTRSLVPGDAVIISTAERFLGRPLPYARQVFDRFVVAPKLRDVDGRPS